MDALGTIKDISALVKKYNDIELMKQIVDLQNQVFELQQDNLRLQKEVSISSILPASTERWSFGGPSTTTIRKMIRHRSFRPVGRETRSKFTCLTPNLGAAEYGEIVEYATRPTGKNQLTSPLFAFGKPGALGCLKPRAPHWELAPSEDLKDSARWIEDGLSPKLSLKQRQLEWAPGLSPHLPASQSSTPRFPLIPVLGMSGNRAAYSTRVVRIDCQFPTHSKTANVWGTRMRRPSARRAKQS